MFKFALLMEPLKDEMPELSDNLFIQIGSNIDKTADIR